MILHTSYLRRRWKGEGGGRLVVRKLNAVVASTLLNSPLYVHTCIVYQWMSADCKLWWVNIARFTQYTHYKFEKKTNSKLKFIQKHHSNTTFILYNNYHVIEHDRPISSSFGEFTDPYVSQTRKIEANRSFDISCFSPSTLSNCVRFSWKFERCRHTETEHRILLALARHKITRHEIDSQKFELKSRNAFRFCFPPRVSREDRKKQTEVKLIRT